MKSISRSLLLRQAEISKIKKEKEGKSKKMYKGKEKKEGRKF